MPEIKILDCKFHPHRKTILSLVGLLVAIIIGLHGYLGERPVDQIGVRAWLDISYTIVLYAIITVSAGGIGWVVLERIGLTLLGEDLEVGLIALVV